MKTSCSRCGRVVIKGVDGDGNHRFFEETMDVYEVDGSHGAVSLVSRLEAGALIPHRCERSTEVTAPRRENLGGASALADDDVGTERLVEGAGEVA
jgi:hypothetical protein